VARAQSARELVCRRGPWKALEIHERNRTALGRLPPARPVRLWCAAGCAAWL